MVPGCVVQIPGGTESAEPRVKTLSFTTTGSEEKARQLVLVDLTATYGCMGSRREYDELNSWVDLFAARTLISGPVIQLVPPTVV